MPESHNVKLFIPLLDNGQGDIKADFLRDFFVGFAGRAINLVRISDSHPGRARNRAVAEFIRSDCTHLLFIDGDIGFQPVHIARMFEHDAPIVGGIYCLKDHEQTRLCLQTLPGHKEIETGGLMPVARVGTGFLRIAREVFERMKSPASGYSPHTFAARYNNHGRDEWDFFQSGVVDGEWLSEDWFFCDRARAFGYEVLIDTEIQLLHEGAIKYPLQRAPERLKLCPPEMKPFIEDLWRGEYAIAELDAHPPATVLDLGANIGGFTEWACERWPDARIFAYEPHPDNATLFRLNTAHRANRVTFTAAAVRALSGHAQLVHGTNCGEHSFAMDGLETTLVRCVGAVNMPAAEFVKIDTEGCEVEILKELDLSAARAVAVEYHSAQDRETIVDLLDMEGFREIEHKPVTSDRGVLKFLRT